MKQGFLKKIICSVGIVLAGIIVGYTLMTLVYCIDVPEERHTDTMEILAEEGYHPRELLRTGKSDYYQENYPDILDIGTDEYIFDYSLRNTDDSCFIRALVEEYGRYWHGYVVFLRPISLLFDLAEIRLINLGIQLFLFLGFTFLQYSYTKKVRYSLVAFAIYFVMGPNSLACNMQYSSIYYVAIISGIVALRFKSWLEHNNRYIYLFLLTGMATAYVDFLTYPLLSWSVPAAVVAGMYVKKESLLKGQRWLEKVIEMIVSALMWGIGYVSMWIGKWLLGIAISDIDVLGEATHEAKLIIGLQAPSLFERMESIFKNWNYLTFKPFVFAFGVIFFCWIFAIIKKGFIKDYRIPAYAIMLLSAPAWYVAVWGHTSCHHIFTWRISLCTVIAAFMIMCLSTDYSSDKAVIPVKKCWIRTLMCVACLILGVLTYWILPGETQQNWNYNYATTEHVLPEGEENSYAMNFYPMFSRIYEVKPVLASEDYEGYLEMALCDGSTILDKKIITFSEAADSNLISIPVDWHLKKGKCYQISFSTANMNKPLKIWISHNTEQFEFDGESALGIGYSYYTHFTSKTISAFYIMCWSSIWLFICYLVLYFSNKSRGAIQDDIQTS